MWSQPKLRWTVRTERLPTRENEHGYSLHDLKNPGKVTRCLQSIPSGSSHCTVAGDWAAPFASHLMLSAAAFLQDFTGDSPWYGVPAAVPISLMPYHILYWLLGTLVKVTRQGYRKLEKNPFSEGVQCYGEKNRLTATQHNGCDASSEAVLGSNAPREGTWPQEKQHEEGCPEDRQRLHLRVWFTTSDSDCVSGGR